MSLDCRNRLLTLQSDFCSNSMLEGWKQDKENFQTADEQLDAYLKFYNACFEVCDWLLDPPSLMLLTFPNNSDPQTSTSEFICAVATTLAASTSPRAHTTTSQASYSTISTSQLTISSTTQRGPAASSR